MGVKSILVAFFLVLLGFSHEPIAASTWVAAGLTAVAVALIGWPARNSGLTSAKGLSWPSHRRRLSACSIRWFHISVIRRTLFGCYFVFLDPRVCSRLHFCHGVRNHFSAAQTRVIPGHGEVVF